MSAAFDTLRLARTLRDKAHFSAEQAEGMADAIAEVMQGNLATRDDVQAIRAEVQVVRTDVQVVRTEVQAVRSELRETELRLKAKIEATKSDLLKWLVGMIVFQTIVLLGAAVALARILTK